MRNCPEHEKVELSKAEHAAWDEFVQVTSFDQDMRALSNALGDVKFNPSEAVIDGFQRSARRMWRP